MSLRVNLRDKLLEDSVISSYAVVVNIVITHDATQSLMVVLLQLLLLEVLNIVLFKYSIEILVYLESL